jgi:hypothetical protein
MYSRSTRVAALALLGSGLSLNKVSKSLGVSRAAIRAWRDQPSLSTAGGCQRCDSEEDTLGAAYAYLLGMYLGDGYLNVTHNGVYKLRVSCADKYPEIISECAASIAAVRRRGVVAFLPQTGCTAVSSYWRHWPCLFPQHGPGHKHKRPIVLETWQRDIVRRHPGSFARGLFHSDGCRIINWTTHIIAGRIKRYEYPRYFFSNEFTDILAICGGTLDLLGVQWRLPRRNMLSVARAASVAILDQHVGPKT